ncbi:L-threonylcarbamoyladenylate synthase [Pontibacter lucknowensis]|uniref:L-threonylcarbamoyladenylate synthase n=1 Tax=Pontibacter lucknowensis TaxID=1077936 RepID=A0A1N6Z3R0_9BACT|nr:L-threonylcarbamoyladenylate synthase [Pontibacter lucknowensis]SIR21453.1 L-threonylcarbamoyladenylate synthase [Pontibacter lucknowensis]
MKHLLKEIQAAEEELLIGNVILYPTDTVWGIGCDAENAAAVKKIFKIKEREESKSMIVLMSDVAMLRRYIEHVPDDFEKLVESQERPTTFVLSGAQNLPKELVADDGSIGVRIAKDEFCHRLMQQIGRPLVSTSANVSGEPSPRTFAEVSDTIKERVDYVVQWRQDEDVESRPSRIIKIDESGRQTVIRE